MKVFTIIQEDQIMENQIIELKAFFMLLRQHDWTYNRADDSRAFAVGQRERAVLLKLCDEAPEYRQLYLAYHDWIWKGGDKPEMPA